MANLRELRAIDFVTRLMHTEVDGRRLTDLEMRTQLAFLLINPIARSGAVDPKAEFLITLTWPDGRPECGCGPAPSPSPSGSGRTSAR